jgi:hypothetical protein
MTIAVDREKRFDRACQTPQGVQNDIGRLTLAANQYLSLARPQPRLIECQIFDESRLEWQKHAKHAPGMSSTCPIGSAIAATNKVSSF